MSGTRPPFFDVIPIDTIHLIPEDTQMIMTEKITIEAGGLLDILGKLVILP